MAKFFKLSYVYIFTIVVYYTVIIVNDFGFISSGYSISRLFAIPLLLVTFLYFLFYFPFFYNKTLKIGFFRYLIFLIFIYTIYYLLSIFNINYYDNLDSSIQLRVFFTALLWMLSFINFFTIGYKIQFKESAIKKFSVILYILASGVIFSDIYYELKGGDIINTSTGYTVLMIMPLLMYLYKNRVFQILMLTIGITLISGKRGALVIEAVILLYYFINSRKIKVKQKKTFYSYVSSFLILIAIIGIGYYAYNYAWDSLQTRFLDIFIGTERSGEIGYGSGRSIFWLMAFNTWYESSVFNNFLGLGFYSTSNTLLKLFGIPIQAHNDYIEILHCFGIVGLAVYLMFQFKLFSFIKKVSPLKINRFILYVSLIILVGRSLFAGILYRPDTLLLAISIGFIIGDLYRKKQLYHEN